jgi:hypothetical protein
MKQMTTYQLDTLTLANIGEEVSDGNRAEYSPLFLNAYNEAYFSLCAGAVKPVAGQVVELDVEKRFSPDDLEKKLVPGGIVGVKTGMDFAENSGFAPAREYEYHWTEDDSIAVPAAQENAQVYFVYRYFPDALTNDDPTDSDGDSSPDLIPEQYQSALASYAAASFFRVRRKFERMQVWMETYLTAVRDLQGNSDQASLKIKNVYMPMP